MNEREIKRDGTATSRVRGSVATGGRCGRSPTCSGMTVAGEWPSSRPPVALGFQYHQTDSKFIKPDIILLSHRLKAHQLNCSIPILYRSPMSPISSFFQGPAPLNKSNLSIMNHLHYRPRPDPFIFPGTGSSQ